MPRFLEYVQMVQEAAYMTFGINAIQSITLSPEEFLDIVIEARSANHTKPYDIKDIETIRTFSMESPMGTIEIVKGELYEI